MVKKNVINYREAGLRASNLRRAVIANNIANLETPGYRRYDVAFQEHLAKAMESGGSVDLEAIKASIIQPMNSPVAPNGNDVNPFTEFGEMFKNDGTYKTYVRLLAKAYRQMELAIDTK